MLAGAVNVSASLVNMWQNSGDAIQRRIERGEIDSIDIIDEYDKLCWQFHIRTREARANLMANLSGQYIDLGKITAVDHVKEKILHKNMVSLDREKWGDSPQIQLNQQFNSFGESDRALGASIMYGHIQGAVNAALPEASIDEKRLLVEKLKRSLSTGQPGSGEIKPAIMAENVEIPA